MGSSITDQKKYVLSLSIIGILYFIFGFVTWLNGTLIPFLRIACELNNFQVYFVAFAFYISYFFMAIPSSWVLYQTGFKTGMSLGLLVMAIGTLVFIPAALTRTFGLFLTGLFIQGAGLSLLQTAVNPYVTIIGPLESAARRISIMGICNKVAGVLGPIILGTIILQGANLIIDQLETLKGVERSLVLDNLAARVILPYSIMAIVLVLLAALAKYSPLPEIEAEEPVVEEGKTKKTSIFQFPHLMLGFLAIFFYVGAEVIAGDTIILYGQSQDIELSQARYFTSFTLTGMVLGYILGIILIPRFISQAKALAFAAILALFFSIIAIFTQGYTSVLFIALLGFANAVMWPAIWPLAIEGLGKFTKTGSAILIMGIAGGALLPLLYGKLADMINTREAYWLLIPCYVFVLYYATRGHKLRKY